MYDTSINPMEPPVRAEVPASDHSPQAVADERTIAVMHGAIENLSRFDLDVFDYRVFAYLAAGVPSRLIMRFDAAALAVERIRRRAMDECLDALFGEAA
jgi:hypothetical protein